MSIHGELTKEEIKEAVEAGVRAGFRDYMSRIEADVGRWTIRGLAAFVVCGLAYLLVWLSMHGVGGISLLNK